MKVLKKSKFIGHCKQLSVYSLPILLGMVCELCYTLADTVFISVIDKSDTSIVSGVGLIFPILFLLASVDQGIGLGISTIVAISEGEKNRKQVVKTANTGFNLSLFLGIFMMLFFVIFSNPLIKMLSGSEVSQNARNVAFEYLIHILPGFLFMFLVQARFSVLQGTGKTKAIGICMVISSGINAILDPIFIFGFGLGVKGASIATVLSQFILLILVSIIYSRAGFGNFKLSNLIKFDAILVRRIFKIGIPSSVSFIILSVSFMAFNLFVGDVGETALNAYTLFQKFESVLVTPVLAFAIGLSIMIGQNYGAKEYRAIRDIFNHGTFFITAITVVMSGLFVIFSRDVFSRMTDNSRVLELILSQVYYVAIPESIGTAVAICASTSFQAIEKPLISTFITGMRTLFLSVPLILLLQNILIPSIVNIWGGIALSILLASLIGFFWFRKSICRIIA